VYSTSYGEAWSELEQTVATKQSLRYVTTIQEDPIWSGDRVLRHLPEHAWLFVVDRIYVYEIVGG
jgi:hypothetical protein